MSRRGRGARALVDELHREVIGPCRPNLLIVLWRWRWEIALVLGGAALAMVIPMYLLLLLATILVCSCTAAPRARHALRNRFWCVMTQHRLRTGMSEADVRSWSGRMPAILWASARPDGEQIFLACPAGLDVRRIREARGELAAACWASDVIVERHPRRPSTIVVHTVRRAVPEAGEPTERPVLHRIKVLAAATGIRRQTTADSSQTAD